MAVSNKNINLLPGWRKPLSGGPNHFVILMSQFSSSVTDPPISRIYISMPKGGIGIVGQPNNPSLKGNIFGVEGVFNTDNLKAYYLTASSGQSTLSGSITTSAVSQIHGYYRTLSSGSNLLNSYYVTTFSGQEDLNSNIDGYDFITLSGYYIPSFSGHLDLDSLIRGIFSDPLFAEYTGVVTETLNSQIDSIEPFSLSGSLSGIPLTTLNATIVNTFEEDLPSSISGYEFFTLEASYTGTGSGILDLGANFFVVKGLEEEELLGASLSGIVSGSNDLFASLIGHTPFSLSGSLEPIPPVDLYSIINPVPSGSLLQGSLSGILPSGSLQASVESSGGFYDLRSLIRSSPGGNASLSGSLRGTGASNLFASINSATNEPLFAAINNPAGAPSASGLNANIIATYFDTLSGNYIPIIGNLLNAEISAIEGSRLIASITPRIFFIDSTIPINTFPFRELKAVINGDSCDFFSNFADLRVSISGTRKEDLTATITSIAGQYAMDHDELDLLIKNEVISEDWIPLIINQPAITQDELPIIITTANVNDLQASIIGLPNNEDLGASITPRYYSNVLRDRKSVVEWVNTKTGERRTVRIYFKGDAINYYYSDLAGDTFSFSPDDVLEIEVESYEAIEEDENSLLSVKTDVKQCTVDNLSDFSSIDEAIRFGITCAVSQIHEDLRAIIVAKGSKEDLSADINPLRIDEILDLNAKYFPSNNLPVLSGNIEASGGFEDLSAFIRPSTPANTSGQFVDTFGQKYVRRLIVHGNDKASIVLTKVLSTDTIPVISPDLRAEIVGIDEATVSGYISGTL